MNQPPKSTPWGESDNVEKLADGIYFVSTPSHGGIWLAPERRKRMGNTHAWYEEDCCAAHALLEFYDEIAEQRDSFVTTSREQLQQACERWPLETLSIGPQ